MSGPLTYLVESIPVNRTRAMWRRFPAHVSQLKPFRVPQDFEWIPQGRRGRTPDKKRPTETTGKRTSRGRVIKRPRALEDYELDSVCERPFPSPTVATGKVRKGRMLRASDEEQIKETEGVRSSNEGSAAWEWKGKTLERRGGGKRKERGSRGQVGWKSGRGRIK